MGKRYWLPKDQYTFVPGNTLEIFYKPNFNQSGVFFYIDLYQLVYQKACVEVAGDFGNLLIIINPYTTDR